MFYISDTSTFVVAGRLATLKQKFQKFLAISENNFSLVSICFCKLTDLKITHYTVLTSSR